MKEPEVLAATANVPSDKIAAAEGLWPNCFHHLHDDDMRLRIFIEV